MEYLVVPLTAFTASCLTFFSGFGLGTLLLPAFALFFPVDVAIALTAAVHLLNNLFKLALLGRSADKRVLVRFGIPAVAASFAGAAALVWFTVLPALASYHIGGKEFLVVPVKLAAGALLVAFSFLEIVPRFRDFSFRKAHLTLGGLLSGFFGGLSGHQGALRSAFLVKAGLGKEAFVATGAVIACLVDVARLSAYSAHFSLHGLEENRALLAVAATSAFAGAFLGSRLLKKITLRSVERIVAVFLILFGVVLAAGLV